MEQSKKAIQKMAAIAAAAATQEDVIRLTYFHGWGLAEQARWVLAATGVEWEQVGLDTRQQFLDLRDKPNSPLLFGQMPLLEIDGLELVQSQAMLRYVARRGGFCPEDPKDQALCDMVAEAVKDARGPLTAFPFKPDLAAHIATLPSHFAKYFPRFERILEAGGGTVIKSGKLCYADVLLAEICHGFARLSPGCLDPYPLLKALMASVTAMPSVVAYLNDPKRRYPHPEGEVGVAYVKNVNTVLGR